MQVFNNSPSAGFIRWSDVSISYKGQVYKIADGSTDFIYVYWKYSDPLSFYGSDVFPTLSADDLMVFLNKNGIHVKVPTATVLDGSLIVPESILTDALSANVVTADKIASNAITTDKLSANSVGAGVIASNAVLSDHIKAGQIKTTHISAEGLDVSKITGAVTNTTFNALETRVTSAEGKFASYVTLTKYNNDINGATNGVIARLSKAETAIDQNETAISLRATKQELDTRMGDVVDRLDSAESQLDINTTAISQRVTTTTYNALAGRVTTAEGKITTQAGLIEAKASQSDLNALDGRLDTAESTLSVLPGQISSKVEKNGVISSINQTAETIKIDVAKVAINGDLEVVNGITKLKNLIVDSAHIKDGAIIERMLSSQVITNVLNAGTAKIDFAKINNVQITDAMINSINANKIQANTIIGNNIIFKGKLEAASGTFTGSLSGATGTFSGSLTAKSLIIDSQYGSTIRIPVGYLSASGDVWTKTGEVAIGNNMNNGIEISGGDIDIHGKLTVNSSIVATGNIGASNFYVGSSQVLNWSHMQARSVNGEHLNNVPYTGLYYGYNMDGSAVKTISTIQTYRYSPDWITQIQQVMGATPEQYIRTKYNGTTWSDWHKFALHGKNATFNDVIATGWTYSNRIVGRTQTAVLLGNGTAQVNSNDGIARWQRDDNNYISQNSTGQITFYMGGAWKHAFNANGTKSGGSIEIDGVNHGMSPIDSPQILIEYIEFDVPLTTQGTKVFLEESYRKAVSNFAVFANNGTVVEKGEDYFVIRGEGTADCRIVGHRIEHEDVFWSMMEEVEVSGEETVGESDSVSETPTEN